MHSSAQRRLHPRLAGFTLVELTIALAVLALLAALAYPNFVDSVRKARRADAIQALVSLQHAQERWRANNGQYASSVAALGAASTTPAGYYSVAVEAADAASYLLAARAVGGRSQAGDIRCQALRLQVSAGQVFYGGCPDCSAPAVGSTATDPQRCWAR